MTETSCRAIIHQVEFASRNNYPRSRVFRFEGDVCGDSRTSIGNLNGLPIGRLLRAVCVRAL
jgi:hypothetical protein